MNDSHYPIQAMPPYCRPMLRLSNSASPIILPEELIVEIISRLPVKTLMKFRCVNKFLKTTISDPHFVQMHLKKSSRNSQLALIWHPYLNYRDLDYFCIPSLLQNKITIIHDSPVHPLNDHLLIEKVVGSCNGLLCLIAYPYTDVYNEVLCFWNPAMRMTSKLYHVRDFHLKHYSFGYDNSTGIYKVVVFYVEENYGYNPKTVVKILDMGDNYSWRDIQCFPVLPLYWFHHEKNNGVYLSGTINWLALRNYFRSSYSVGWSKGVTVEQYVIVSLDLSTESYTQMLLPCGFDEVPHVQPIVEVLVNSLCFGHDFEKKHFVIWRMKDFGVQESWVQLFKIDYFYSSKHLFDELQRLYLYDHENCHTLIFSNGLSTFIYNCIDNEIEEIRARDSNTMYWLWGKDYFESLIPTC